MLVRKFLKEKKKAAQAVRSSLLHEDPSIDFQAFVLDRLLSLCFYRKRDLVDTFFDQIRISTKDLEHFIGQKFNVGLDEDLAVDRQLFDDGPDQLALLPSAVSRVSS